MGGKEAERHPERRAKAAYKAFEETMLPQMRADHPGLKLSQYKQKIFDSVGFILDLNSSSSMKLIHLL